LKLIKKKIRRWKREHDEESPASEPEEPDDQIQSHVPVLNVEDTLFHSDSSGLISPPPPPPETLELPPPPPEEGGKVPG